MRHLVLLLTVLSSGCLSGGGSGGGGGESGDAGTFDDAGTSFSDHTVSGFTDTPSLVSFLVSAPGRGQVKFIIPHFLDAASRDVLFLDGRVYSMHDEWFWLRLLNGRRVPGVQDAPVSGLNLPTPDDVRDWARDQASLPLDLRWVRDERLYSPRFYELVFGDHRRFGVGGVLHMLPSADGTPPAIAWAFELEYGDSLDHSQLVRFFETLEGALPDEVARALFWVTRSPAQHALGDRMRSERLPYWERVVRYSALARRGEVAVYSPGLTAGSLRVVRSGEAGLDAARPRDVLVLEDLPDWLPPGTALVSAVPQTPLAHVNLLARNRGIPNAYVGGILEDPELDQLARGHSPVLVHAAVPDRLDLLPMGREAYNRYLELSSPPRLRVPAIDLTNVPLTIDLADHGIADMDRLRFVVGGKSAGFLALRAVVDDPRAPIASPDRPLAITIRAFEEHVGPLEDRIGAMLLADDFRREARARALVLEGTNGLAKRFPAVDADAWAATFLDAHRPGDALGDLARDGGLVRVIRDRPLPPELLVELRQVLEARYGDYAPSQGLRFRSSANVEDIEGFSAAGLYESSTGFLDAAAQTAAKDRKKTVEWALKRTLASYWSVEAYEERTLSNVDHESGAMAVLVHARFDDPLEESNGVFILTLFPPGADLVAAMDLNVQAGDLSVTNPPVGSSALPEIVRVTASDTDAAPAIRRVRASTEVPAGDEVLDDATLLAIFAAARRVGDAWLTAANAGISPARAARVAVLDFELRAMAPGWPALASGEAFDRRVVLKQVRSLDPGLLSVPAGLLARPFPKDVLARARRIDRHVCRNSTFLIDAWEAWTDPGRAPDLGHSEEAFLAGFSLRFGSGGEGLPYGPGDTFDVDHTQLRAVSHPATEGGGWAVRTTLAPEAAASIGLSSIEVSADGPWALAGPAGEASGDVLACDSVVVHATPSEYLRELLEAAERP